MSDFRERFGLSLRELDELPQVEVAALFKGLAEDISTRVGAIVNDFNYPVTLELLAAADMFDLECQVNHSGKGEATRHPRPWIKKTPKAGKIVVKMTQAESKAFWAKRGHNITFNE